MTKQYLMGVDLGTSATKSALYTLEGECVAVASASVPLYYPQPGVVEQENEDFYQTAAQSVYQCLQESGVDPRQVKAIAFDSQMAGVGSIDQDFNPATRFDSWLDMRCQPYIEQINRYHGDRVTQLTGCPPTCDHAPKILWWQNEQPADYARVAKFVMPSTYVAGKMAGLKADQAFIDYTFIHFSGLSDAQNGCWSTELCDLLGVNIGKLPKIVEPWRVVGEVQDDPAKSFGLAPGTIIAAGCGDTAANALGAGIVKPGMLFDVAGTASVLASCTDTFVADRKSRTLLTMRSVIPGLWNPLAYIGGGGQALRWFRDQFFNSYRGQSQEDSTELYEALTSLAEPITPGADGLFFSPHLGGRICPATPEMRGTWLGFSWGHTQAHFFRAVLESVAFEYAYYLSILRELVPDLSLLEARAVGGGASSDVWNQIKADVLNLPYQRLQRKELGTWGSAMIAGKAVGVYDDLGAVAAAHARPDNQPFHPRLENQATYQRLVEKYINLQRALEDVFVGFYSV